MIRAKFGEKSFSSMGTTGQDTKRASLLPSHHPGRGQRK